MRPRRNAIYLTLRLALAVILLPGLLIPVTAEGCSCACCCSPGQGQHPMPSGIHHMWHGEPGGLDESNRGRCNHCTFNPQKKPGMIVYVTSNYTFHPYNPVRQATLSEGSRLPMPQQTITDRTIMPRIRSAPIYLQTLSIRC